MSIAASGNCGGPMAPLLGGSNLAAGAITDTFLSFLLWCFIWENCPMSKNLHSETGKEIPFYIEQLSCHLCFITDTWRKIVALRGKSTLKPWKQEVSAHGEPPYGQRFCLSTLAPDAPRSGAWPALCAQLSIQLLDRDMSDALAATAISWAITPDGLNTQREQP